MTIPGVDRELLIENKRLTLEIPARRGGAAGSVRVIRTVIRTIDCSFFMLLFLAPGLRDVGQIGFLGSCFLAQVVVGKAIAENLKGVLRSVRNLEKIAVSW